MNDDVIRDMLRRLDALERTRPRLRIGEVTDTGPLDVSLGGADTSYEDVAALGGPHLATGDRVAALTAGNDLLVLGAIGGLRSVRGLIGSTGTVTAGNGFTVTKGATGVYTVNFDPVFSAAPSVAVMVNNTVGGAGYASLTASACLYVTLINGTTASDQPHSFIAIGPA